MTITTLSFGPPSSAVRSGRPATGAADARQPAALRRGAAFAGPAFLVSVGYMDPGNWGTDLAAGSRFGHSLLWVLLVCNVVALFLQRLAAKLGIASGRDLAALVGARSGPRVRRAYAAVALGAMLATETAEFLGVVVALRMLLGLPLSWAVALGAVLVLGLLSLGRHRFRPLERMVFGLLAVVAVCYVVELSFDPPGIGVLGGAVPSGLPAGSLPVIVGMVGATVMPHNLFLHSGLILSRRRPDVSPRRLLRRAVTESAVALNLALLVNVAILLLAATTFHGRGIEVDSLAAAHQTLTPLLGAAAAGVFALALLAAGLSSAVTGGLATQYVVDGLVPRHRLPVLARRLVTLIPAVVLLASGVGEVTALIWSQVVLALVLPAVVLPLVLLTSDRGVMGDLVNARRTRRIGLGIACALSTLGLVAVLDIVL